MRALYIFLTMFAALLTFSVVSLTIVSIAHGGKVSIALPGLNLVVSMNFVILLLAVFDAAIIVGALCVKRLSEKNLP